MAPDREGPPDRAIDPEARFAALAAALAEKPGVTLPDLSNKRFGSSALKVNAKIFAMLTRNRLVVKLPGKRVSAMIDDHIGEPFNAGKGTPMKEWAAVTSDDPTVWLEVTLEALQFASGESST